MSPLNSLVLGLGLFFLGLQLVGQNLRQLSGGGFRQLVKSATHTPVLAALLGLLAGALMQSATAVTFILVSMVGSGIIQTAPARVIVIWCNVGLTGLAFLAAFDIHPLVACLVGGAGIFMGSVRAKPWNTIAGALLGVGLILFALGEMSEGAAPLRDTPWFREGLDFALASPLSAFACGVAAAAILQSNTGAAMLVITLAGAGAIPVDRAIPVIYGTNLGAIVLRLFLSAGMTGGPLRLVRMEDLFCVISGVLMMTLFYIEAAGVPLIGHLAGFFAGDATRLAVVFFLSNLIPAIVIMPVLEPCAGMVKKIWPGDVKSASLLTPQALADPASALDLIPRELSRLLASIAQETSPGKSDDPEVHAPAAFVAQALAVEQFCARLMSENTLTSSQAATLQRLRAWLHTIRHIAEAVGEFNGARLALPADGRPVADGLVKIIQDSLHLAATATDALEPQAVSAFHVATGHHLPAIETVREKFKTDSAGFPRSVASSLAAMLEDFDIAIWLTHRLAKLETRVIAAQT